MTPPSAKPETEAPDQIETDADAPVLPETVAVQRLQPGQVRRGPGLDGGGVRRPFAQNEGGDAPLEGASIGAAGQGNGPGHGMGRGRGLNGGPGGGVGGGRPGGPPNGPRMQAQARRLQEEKAAENLALVGTNNTDLVGEHAEVNGQTVAPTSPPISPYRADSRDKPVERHQPLAADGGGRLDRPLGRRLDDAAFDEGNPPATPKPGKRKNDVPVNSYIPKPTVQPAQMRQRHWGLILMFVLLAVVPTAIYGWYMYARAADQYESDVGFGSRTEEAASPFAFLGALGGLTGASSSNDMDILNQFIISQELVSRIDKKLNLRAIFSKPQNDPVMAFSQDGKIEDLVRYWQHMVVPNYDSTTGLMSLKVFAFEPKDAQNIAQAVLDESTSVINELSLTAQNDATKYGRVSLEKAKAEMVSSQKDLTQFRILNHIVDPTSAMAGASAVVTSLITQLAAAEIELDMLSGTVPDSDPRIAQMNRRLDVIQKRLAEEQAKVGGLADPNGAGYAQILSDYETLQMEADFDGKAYLTALGAYEQAVNSAQQQTRYLATYVAPTLAESSQAPDRPLRILLVAMGGMLAWAALSMIYYALRDRR